jgi:hypothetical protein
MGRQGKKQSLDKPPEQNKPTWAAAIEPGLIIFTEVKPGRFIEGNGLLMTD